MTEKFVRRAIIDWLSRKGYSRGLREKHTDEHGVDIKVRHNNYARYFIVETKGGTDAKKVKHPRSRREVYFIYVLGQIATRMNTTARYNYGVGLPDTYREKVMRRLPWQFCKNNNLFIFLVNKEGKVNQFNWKQLKAHQGRLKRFRR
ncbi:hypothetical protein KJA13_04110 [Patescibacteria group bacterium]|nr:hypothetical protein [Patescibacteria group bacterium]